jgi:hypothetical protein
VRLVRMVVDCRWSQFGLGPIVMVVGIEGVDGFCSFSMGKVEGS